MKLRWTVRLVIRDGQPPVEMSWSGEAGSRAEAILAARQQYPNALATFDVQYISCERVMEAAFQS